MFTLGVSNVGCATHLAAGSRAYGSQAHATREDGTVGASSGTHPNADPANESVARALAPEGAERIDDTHGNGDHVDVYVDGPHIVDGRDGSGGQRGYYEAKLIVVNHGTRAVDLTRAEIRFEVREGGRVIACTAPTISNWVAGEARIVPPRARRTLRAMSGCDMEGQRGTEVLASLRFATAAEQGGAPRVVHHTSRTEIER